MNTHAAVAMRQQQYNVNEWHIHILKVGELTQTHTYYIMLVRSDYYAFHPTMYSVWCAGGKV